MSEALAREYMARPGGNPNLKKYQFKVSDGEEPATELLAIRIPQSLSKKLKALGKERNLIIKKALEDLVANLPQSS